MARNGRGERGRRSTHPVATVDIEGLSDDVAGVVAGQEHRGAGVIVRTAHSAQRHGFADQTLFLAERTLLVHAEGGFYRTGLELLFRDSNTRLPIGTTIAIGDDVTVTIIHATPDGVPDEASFDFLREMEDGYVFRSWNGDGLVPFTLPRLGESVTFPGRLPGIG